MLMPARSFVVFSAVALMVLSGLFFSPGNSSAMQKLAEEDLDEITGQQGFSRFSFETVAGISTATVDLNIHAEIYAEVEDFRAHYRPITRAGVPISEWDQDWRNVTLGESVADPLKLEHFVFEVEFENFDAINRRLISVKMGFETVNGTMTIDELHSFTGTYGGENFFRINANDVPDPAGTASEFVFADNPFYIVFDSRGWDGTEVPEPPNYNRGGHDLAEFENHPLVRFDFGDAVRNTLP